MATLTPAQLQSYLNRIKMPTKSGRANADFSPNLATLCAVKWSHLKQIPFENLSLRLDVAKKHPSLASLDASFEKLVEARRGGICYEHNVLFSAALRALGFSVIDAGARIVSEPTPDSPNVLGLTPNGSHRLEFVGLDGDFYLADVGFGGGGAPLPLALPHEAHMYCQGSTGTDTVERIVVAFNNQNGLEMDPIPIGMMHQYRLAPGLQGVAPAEKEGCADAAAGGGSGGDGRARLALHRLRQSRQHRPLWHLFRHTP